MCMRLLCGCARVFEHGTEIRNRSVYSILCNSWYMRRKWRILFFSHSSFHFVYLFFFAISFSSSFSRRRMGGIPFLKQNKQFAMFYCFVLELDLEKFIFCLSAVTVKCINTNKWTNDFIDIGPNTKLKKFFINEFGVPLCINEPSISSVPFLRIMFALSPQITSWIFLKLHSFFFASNGQWVNTICFVSVGQFGWIFSLHVPPFWKWPCHDSFWSVR